MGDEAAYVGLRDRDYFHIMLNLEAHAGFLPTARSLADRFLEEARKQQGTPGLEPELRSFAYTREDLDARLDLIHQGLVDDVSLYEAGHGWTLTTRDEVVGRLLQMAPFNQTDGAWLRRIGPTGPVDDVRATLFGIFMDEVGAGEPELNHANIYTTLLQSVGVYLPDIRSRDYADSHDLIDSAFTLPLFQLVVGEFPQTYFPEILGMTQYLEWSSDELKNMVRLLEHHEIDTHFFELHVAIDNVANGHGAMAKRAVKLFLERTRAELGEEAMQTQWHRIWNGYVAFATTGTLAEDVRKDRPGAASPAEVITAIVNRLAPRARVSHGQKRLGDHLINDLVDNPSQLIASLVEAGMIVPGAPDRSPFFALLASDGPMFKVFTDAEIASWKTWVTAIASPASDPLAAGGPVAPRPLTFLSPRERVASHPTGMIHGSGSVH